MKITQNLFELSKLAKLLSPLMNYMRNFSCLKHHFKHDHNPLVLVLLLPTLSPRTQATTIGDPQEPTSAHSLLLLGTIFVPHLLPTFALLLFPIRFAIIVCLHVLIWAIARCVALRGTLLNIVLLFI